MESISEISLIYYGGRMIKYYFNGPEIEKDDTKIGNLSEERDISFKGILIRLQDIKTSIRKKSVKKEGNLRSFDTDDFSGSIREIA